MKAKTLKNVFKILLLTVSVFIVGCKENIPNYKENMVVESADVDYKYDAVGRNDKILDIDLEVSNIPKDLKIIKSANARYKVKSVKDATKKIKRIAQKHEAYISDLRFQNDLYKKENRFTIKVPQKYFDKVMDSVNNVAEFVEFENITTQDVTEEYVDLETRLKTKLEVKSRYELILRKNAKTVEDILATEDKLRIIQEEIESAQGRLKYLSSKVAFSTIQIDLYETVDYKTEPESYTKTFWSKAKERLFYGWDAIESMLLFFMNIWPILIAGTVLFFVFRKKIRK